MTASASDWVALAVVIGFPVAFAVAVGLLAYTILSRGGRR